MKISKKTVKKMIINILSDQIAHRRIDIGMFHIVNCYTGSGKSWEGEDLSKGLDVCVELAILGGKYPETIKLTLRELFWGNKIDIGQYQKAENAALRIYDEWDKVLRNYLNTGKIESIGS